MSEDLRFENIPLGFDLGTMEMVLDDDTVKDRVELVQWKAMELIDKLHTAPPGVTIHLHPRMRFAKFTNLRAAIWAKSEHEFLKPKKVGSKVFIKGRVIDKYIKRDKKYVVSEFETVDENGEVLLRSLETGVHLED